MHIEEEKRDDVGVTILHVKGDMWGGDEWALNTKVSDLIEDDCKRIVIDLTKVARVNSQGIGVLMASLNSMREADGDLKIAGANPNITAHLDLLKLIAVLELYPTAADAINSFEL